MGRRFGLILWRWADRIHAELHKRQSGWKSDDYVAGKSGFRFDEDEGHLAPTGYGVGETESVTFTAPHWKDPTAGS